MPHTIVTRTANLVPIGTNLYVFILPIEEESFSLSHLFHTCPRSNTTMELQALRLLNLMNAIECRTLTATCMHDSCACIAWLTVYACSISGVLIQYQEYLTTYPAPEHGYGYGKNGIVLFRVSA